MTEFIGDEALDYRLSRTPFQPGAGLVLDEAYRRAHLPLVAPAHPACITEDPERGYKMGRHETIWSLVIPVPAEFLVQSSAFEQIETELRASPIAPKIAWQVTEARRNVLHVTICGALGRGQAPSLTPGQRAAFAAMKPFSILFRGLFSGNVNLGRLYLPLYPENRGGNVIGQLQKALGRPSTSLYVLGLHNLTDHLSPDEAQWLADALIRWEAIEIGRLTVDHLWLLGSRDDLALDSEVAEIIHLG